MIRTHSDFEDSEPTPKTDAEFETYKKQIMRLAHSVEGKEDLTIYLIKSVCGDYYKRLDAIRSLIADQKLFVKRASVNRTLFTTIKPSVLIPFEFESRRLPGSVRFY